MHNISAKKLRILHLNASDNYGGAAKAALRLHIGLLNRDVDSRMLVQDHQLDENFIYGPANDTMKVLAKFRPYLDRVPLWLYSKSIKMQYHIGWLPDFLKKTIRRINPDIIHLHWVCDGFLNLDTLRHINKPIVWTFHDMWPFTGGCHYCGECNEYERMCGKCPQLDSRFKYDISRWAWKKKKYTLKGLRVSAVCPSLWLAGCARRSSIFKGSRIEIIPYNIDLAIYKPFNRMALRSILNLPGDMEIILFGSVKGIKDERKGFDLLLSALKEVDQKGDLHNKALVIFGDSCNEILKEFNMPIFSYGYLHDDLSLSMLYGASDVFVLPTRQDNLPNTIIEAMACGTPCVSFDVGGVPDMIRHKENGYVAKPSDSEDLASGIRWVLENSERRQALSRLARKTAEEIFDINKVAQQYENLYSSLF